ncbi:MAG: hypothetical protein P1U87_00975 [Verrucomicrobiales bacterium]|nr:hypothetical protein [Verrucomicrobiales bacterium]
MRKALLLTLVSLLLLCQTSCGLLMNTANRAKHVLQWPFRAALDPRFLDPASELDREWVNPRFA